MQAEPVIIAIVAAAVGVPAGLLSRRIASGFVAPERIAPLRPELAGAALFAWIGVWFAEPALVVPVCALAGWCLCLSTVDILEHRLPNVLTLSGAVAVLAIGVASGHGRQAFGGAALLVGLYLAIHLAVPQALGAGDVKLAAGLGGVAGMGGGQTWLLAAILAPLATAAAGVVLACWRSGRGSRVVAHGPSMCVATVIALAAAVA